MEVTGDGHLTETEERSVDQLSLPRRAFRLCFPNVAAVILAFLVCVAAPTALIAVHIHENPMFSPIDEAAHYDYVTRIADGGFPRLGQKLQPSTLRDIACIGTALSGLVTPPCDAHVLRANEFAGGGYQYEAQQPPTYYAITVPLRWVAIHVFGLGDLSGTRATGAVWLVAGLLMLWAAGRLVGLDPKVIGVAILLIATAPLVVYQSSIVSNDVPSVFTGCLMALLGALAWRRPGRWVSPTLFFAGFFVASIKLTDALPVAVLSALFAILAWSKRTTGEGSIPALRSWLSGWWSNGGLLILGSLVSGVAWTLISRKLSLINPRDLPTFSVLRTHPVGLLLIAREALTMFAPATDAYTAFRSNDSATVAAMSTASQNLQAITATVLEYVLIAGGLAGIFVRRRNWEHWLGLLTLPVLYIGGLILGIGLWITYNATPGLSGRYGLALVPFLVLALVASTRGKWILSGLWIFALATLGLTFFYMLSS